MLFTLPCSSAVEQLTVNQLVVCSIHTGGAIIYNYFMKRILFAFTFIISMSAFSEISNTSSNWYVVTDQVMGGKSELQADFDNGVFSLSGYVTTVNNGGFVRLSHRPQNLTNKIQGIRFVAKGNNEKYEVHVTMQGLRMPPWAYHSSIFEVTKDWQTFEINFSDFEKKSGMSPKLNPSSIRDISFAGYGRNFDVDLMITEVSFF